MSGGEHTRIEEFGLCQLQRHRIQWPPARPYPRVLIREVAYMQVVIEFR